MARLPLLLYPNRDLTLLSDDVGIDRARSEEFRELLDRMVETMTWYRGIGLSAIQVGVQDRAFVMRTQQGILKLVDPKFETLYEEAVEMPEGCLSVPGYTETVLRHPQVVLSALDIESGERKRYDFYGIEAQCVQHEMDHLDGKMFTDGYGTAKRDVVKRKIKNALRFDPTFKELT